MSQLQVTGEAKIRDIQGPVVANSGVITALDGAASQYVRGDGTLADFPTSTGGGSSVSYYLNSSVSQGTIGGVAYRELSKEPIIGAGTDITISANGYVANYITDANDPDVLSVPGGNFNCEFYFSVNNNTGNPTTYAELYKYDGTTFTLLGSSQAVPESLNQGTTIAPYYFAIPVATAALALTDRLAIRIYVSVDGRVVTLHTENSHLCQVVTTFSKGMVSLNNLTDQSQFITTGTSGTNFNIVSSGDTHTFNLPVASATNTGKLSNTDWSTFNNKVPYTGAISDVNLGNFNFDANQIYGLQIVAKLNGTGSSPLILRTGTSGYSYGNDSISLISSPTSANTLIITSDVSSVTKIAQFGLGSLTATRTFTLPDLSGTLALLEGTQTFSGAKTFSNLVTIETASYLTSRLKLNNTATGGNSWSLSSGNQNNSTNNGLFTIINETLNKNTFVLGPTGKLDIGADLGTINPAFALSIYDTNPVLRVYDLAGNASSLNLQATNSSAFISAAYGTTAIPLVLRTGNTDRLTIAANGAMTLSSNVTTTGSQFVQNGFYLTNANAGATAGYTHMWGADDGIFFGLRNATGGAKFVFQSATSYNYTFPAATGTLALTSNLSAYLPLTGGTLTGALSGTSASFSSNVNVGTNIAQLLPITTTNFQILTGCYYDGSNIIATATSGTRIISNAGSFTFNNFTGATIGGSVTDTTRLTIASTGAATFSSSVTANGIITVNEDGAGTKVLTLRSNWAGVDPAINVTTNNSLLLMTNNTERMRITSGGNVGIGTSSTLSAYALTISRASGGGIGALSGGAGDANYYSSSATIGYHLYGDQGGAARVYILGNGDIRNTNNSYGAISDISLKENIIDATPKLNDLLKVKIRNYNLIDDNTKTKQIGVIAQELEEIFPNMISEEKQMGSDELIKTVKYSVFVPMLIKAIQESHEIIKDLEARIVSLESK